MAVSKGIYYQGDPYNLIKPVDTYTEYQPEDKWDTHDWGSIGLSVVEPGFSFVLLIFVSVFDTATTSVYLPANRGPPVNNTL